MGPEKWGEDVEKREADYYMQYAETSLKLVKQRIMGM